MQWALFTRHRPLADRHRFTSARRFQCSPFTLPLRNYRYARQSTGGFNQHFPLCSPKYRFTHKTPWEFRPQFTRCIIIISLSFHLVRMANTHDHKLRPSAHPYRLQTTATSYPAQHRTYINLKKADWTRYRQEIERKLSSRHLPTDCQKYRKLFRATLLKAASHHIPTGRHKLYTH